MNQTELLDNLFELIILKSNDNNENDDEKINYIEKILNSYVQLESHISTEYECILLEYFWDYMNIPIMKLLFKRNKSNIYCLNENNDSILHNLIDYEPNTYKTYLQFIDLNLFHFHHQNKDGDTILHPAAIEGISFCEILIQHPRVSKDILNIKNNFNETLLFNLVRNNSLSCIKLCIEKGADIFVKDINNKTIFTLAKEFNHHDIIDYLSPLFECKINLKYIPPMLESPEGSGLMENIKYTTNIQLFDTVYVDKLKKTGIVLMNNNPNYNFVSIAINNPTNADEMKIQNILKSEINKIEKPLQIEPGDFIYDIKMLQKDLLVMNDKCEKYIVRQIQNECITLENIKTEISVFKEFPQNVPYFFKYWVAT